MKIPNLVLKVTVSFDIITIAFQIPIITAIHIHESNTNNVAIGLTRQDVICKAYNRSFSIKISKSTNLKPIQRVIS